MGVGMTALTWQIERLDVDEHHARLARDLFPDQDPIGRRLKFGDANSTSPWETIVGVVGQDPAAGFVTDVLPAMLLAFASAAMAMTATAVALRRRTRALVRPGVLTQNTRPRRERPRPPT